MTSLLGTSVSNWKMKGLNSLGWDTSFFSQAELSSPFSPSCSSVCVSLTLGFGLALAAWSLYALLSQVDSKVLEGRAAQFFSASSTTATRRYPTPRQDRDVSVPDTGQVPSHCLHHLSTPELPDAESRAYFHCDPGWTSCLSAQLCRTGDGGEEN